VLNLEGIAAAGHSHSLRSAATRRRIPRAVRCEMFIELRHAEKFLSSVGAEHFAPNDARSFSLLTELNSLGCRDLSPPQIVTAKPGPTIEDSWAKAIT
jgi:hypothetical protein